MPSASSKTENKAALEVQDPFKAAQSVVEKKLRNLEKRKGKIEVIKEKKDQGERLNADQQKSIESYEGVVFSIEVAQDLQKQFSEIQAEVDKLAKKKVRLEKKEKAEKRAADVNRVKQVLELQSLLDCLGTDAVRSHFKAGKHKAKVLTDDNLQQLDDFFKLISPAREDSTYSEDVGKAAEHIFSYLEGREAEAAGTTYKDLHKLVKDVLCSGYFTGFPHEDDPEPTEAPEPEPQPEEDEAIPTTEKLIEQTEVELEEAVVSLEQLKHGHVTLTAHEQTATQANFMPPDLNNIDASQFQPADDDSYFSVGTGFPNTQRPFQEIVSSVQGTFNFLQESQISSESAHVDPAVVAAQPMHVVNPAAVSDHLHTNSYQSMLSDDQLSHLTSQQQQATQQQVMVDHMATDPSQAPLDNTYSHSHSQDYSQISQTTYSTADQSSVSLNRHSHPAMEQVIGGPELPPSIPLPIQTGTATSTTLPEQAITQESQEKKPFAMNPNAAMFQSMYNTSMPSGHSQSGGPPHMTAGVASSQPTSMTADKPLPSSDYSNGFGGGSYGGRPGSGPSSRGGGGMRGGRGGRGSNPMSNGYSRGSSRGGAYNSGRGGNNYSSNNRGSGGRGGGAGMRGPPRGGGSDRGARGMSRGGYGGRPN